MSSGVSPRSNSLCTAIVLGFVFGSLMGFVDSYSYAVSGFTTAEISVVLIPILIAILSSVLGIRLDTRSLVVASSIAIGIDITTTLTAGMYITYGYLSYLAERLKVFGLDVEVPEYLFALDDQLFDLKAMPTYVLLSFVSLGGAFIAYALRLHYLERERLTYPLGVISSILIKVVKRLKPSYLVAIAIGLVLEQLSLNTSLFIDLTPVTSSLVPGAIFALAADPLIIALLFLLPLGPLTSISIGSLTTYLVLIPLAVILGGVSSAPMINYEDALFAYSNIAASVVVGMIAIMSIFYIAMYHREFKHSFKLVFSLRLERASFFTGIALLLLMIPLALAMTVYSYSIQTLLICFVSVVLLHIMLTLVNLRIVGEAGIGSQAALPIATALLYSLGIKDIGIYAATDPFTGIPMPQVVGGTTMNIIRFSRLNGVKSSLALFGVTLGIAFGSFITFLYGNILVHVYGFESPQMPLHRWIPTLVWMSTVYTGYVEALHPTAIAIGCITACLLLLIAIRFGYPVFPFIIGASLPPDIGFMVLVVMIIKRVLVKLGVEVHEKTMILASLILLGCGLGVLINVVTGL